MTPLVCTLQVGFRGSNASGGRIVLLPGAFWAHGASKMVIFRERKMRTKFFCTNFLNTARGPGHPSKIPGTSRIPLSETQGRQSFEGGHEVFGHHPFAWKTPTPPGGLRTQKLNLCALFSCLNFGSISSSLLSTIFQSSGGHASARRVSHEPCFRQAHCFVQGPLRFLPVSPNPTCARSHIWGFPIESPLSAVWALMCRF